jgi:ACS family tartrate transporter-like MFS transporter
MTGDKIFAKCAWRLIPFLSALYFMNLLDRVNVGFAALTMNHDLGFSPSIFGFGAGILFVGYALFVVPSSIFLERIGARRGLFIILVAWGLLSAGCAFVRDPLSFYVLRFLLGIAEAGFMPGVFYFLSLWFPHAWRARAIAVFMLGGSISNIFSGALSGALLGMNNLAGLHGWQWLFLIEGLPAFLLGFAALAVLADRPSVARWLTTEEKSFIARRMAEDPAAGHRALGPALRDMRVIALGVAWFGVALSIYGFDLWLPQIVHAMGFSNLQTGFIAIPIFALGMAAQIFVAQSSDARKERVWHVAIPALAGAAGWLIAGTFSASLTASLIGLTAVRMGMTSIYGPIYATPFSFLSGPAAAGGVALMTAIGSFGGFVGPTAMGVLRQQTGGYAAGMALLAFGLVVTAATMLLLGRTMAPRIAPVPQPIA